jgi:predicted nucleic acid-binding protein
VVHRRRRPGGKRLCAAFADLFFGARPAFRTVWTGEDVLREAVALHLKHYDRRLSLADSTLLAHAARLGAAVATLDAQFSGLVEVEA